MSDNPIAAVMIGIQKALEASNVPWASFSAIMYLAANQTLQMSEEDAVATFKEARSRMAGRTMPETVLSAADNLH